MSSRMVMVLFLPAQFLLHCVYLIVPNLSHASVGNGPIECTLIRRMDISKCSSLFYNKTATKCFNNHTRSAFREMDKGMTFSSGLVYTNISEAGKRCLEHPGFVYKSFGRHNGACVKYFYKTASWSVARNKCTREKARLVQIDTEEKNHAYAIISSSFGKFWLGGNDIDKEGSWVWTDGTPVPGPWIPGAYHNWRLSEPDGGIVQNCMSMIPFVFSPKWMNGGCDGYNDRRRFICERTP